jgi:hypothetical protein
MDSLMVTLRWEEPAPGLRTLLVGRLAAARIYWGTGHWEVELLLAPERRRRQPAVAEEAEARALAEAHARRVLGDA